MQAYLSAQSPAPQGLDVAQQVRPEDLHAALSRATGRSAYDRYLRIPIRLGAVNKNEEGRYEYYPGSGDEMITVNSPPVLKTKEDFDRYHQILRHEMAHALSRRATEAVGGWQGMWQGNPLESGVPSWPEDTWRLMNYGGINYPFGQQEFNADVIGNSFPLREGQPVPNAVDVANYRNRLLEHIRSDPRMAKVSGVLERMLMGQR
jgi:hypothetical protein